MTDNENFSFVLEDADKFEGLRGPQRRTLATKDGLVAATVLGLKYKGKSGKGNHVVTASFATVDSDPGMNGVALWKHVPITGENPQGKNIVQLYNIMLSAGVTKDKLAALSGKSLTTEALSDALKGKTCYVQIRAEIYENNPPSSQIVAFISQEDYEREATVGNHRTKHSYGDGSAASAAPANGAASRVVAPAAPPSGGASDLTL